jgi:hypothetical protein
MPVLIILRTGHVKMIFFLRERVMELPGAEKLWYFGGLLVGG